MSNHSPTGSSGSQSIDSVDWDPATYDIDNVRNDISREELLGLSDNERSRQIVAWANWWFRPDKFFHRDSDIDWAWGAAIKNRDNFRYEIPDDLSFAEEAALERVKQGMSPVRTVSRDDRALSLPVQHRAAFLDDQPDKDDFLQGYNYYRQKWLDSDQCLGLERVLEEADVPFVDKIVAFGITSSLFTKSAIRADLNDTIIGPNEHLRYMHKHNFIQFAILMRMAEILESQHGQHIAVYVQSPSLRPSEEDALEELGFNIAYAEYDYQQGFTKIDDHTLVYDAIVSFDIYQIYMQYALPAAVITSLLDERKVKSDEKYVVIQDPEIEDGRRMVWSQPLDPAAPTREPFNILSDYYHEISLYDEGSLDEQRRHDDMTVAEIYRGMMEQVQQELRDYNADLQAAKDAKKHDDMDQGRFDEQEYRRWAGRFEMARKYHQPPPQASHKNFSEQAQLALYVRKRGVIPSATW